MKARINAMHLNDCMRGIELHTNLGFNDDLEDFARGSVESARYWEQVRSAVTLGPLTSRGPVTHFMRHVASGAFT